MHSPVADASLSRVSFESYAPLQQRLAVRLLENRQHHLVANQSAQGLPIDVEVARRHARRTIGEHLPPEQVVNGIGRHVIRNDIEDGTDGMGTQAVAEL